MHHCSNKKGFNRKIPKSPQMFTNIFHHSWRFAPQTGLFNVFKWLPPFTSSLRSDSRILRSPKRSEFQGTIICQDQVLQLHLHVNPFIIRQAGPHMMRLCHLVADRWPWVDLAGNPHNRKPTNRYKGPRIRKIYDIYLYLESLRHGLMDVHHLRWSNTSVYKAFTLAGA